jgi:hypothetical protein
MERKDPKRSALLHSYATQTCCKRMTAELFDYPRHGEVAPTMYQRGFRARVGSPS